jgi:hypothetical protein
VLSFSNKSYSQNFKIDSKVILYDIFYDTSVNFLCICPLLYTTGMCDVYNIYLYGKCFLPMMYNDIICLMSAQSTLLFLSSDSSSHTYATSRSSSLCTEHHTSCRNTAYSVFACSANTRNTAVVFLWKANGVNALLPVNRDGMQLDLVCPLKCH